MKRPVLQKRRAKRLKNFNISSWPEKAEDLLRLALSAKFSQDIDLRDLLLPTGESTIGEANSHDTLFGIGLSLQNPNAMDTKRWRGDNLQGKILMAVREELK